MTSIQPDNVGELEGMAAATSIAAHGFRDGMLVHINSFDLLSKCMPLQDLIHLRMFVIYVNIGSSVL